jgi:MoaA/NifB/PqqE/SkfB family radical SAM enzyme
MGVQPTMVTNGWLLPGKLDAIAGTGISTVFVSIDSEDAAAHEKNRGLKAFASASGAPTRRWPAAA